MNSAALSGPDTYFEDYWPGQRIRHARAVTIDAVTGGFMAKSVMNTAQVHWNDRVERDGALGAGFVVFGMITASTVLGLAGQDTIENVIREIEYDDFRFLSPVYQGDTIQAYSEVLDVQVPAARGDAGLVVFKHWGVNHRGKPVFSGVRKALIRRRASSLGAAGAPPLT